MGVDIDSFAFRLFQQKLQIPQIMPSNNNKGTLLNLQGHGSGHRISKSLGICPIQ